ncbi:hypothetical protein AADZ84_17470 [Colwelliaceae bacterium MEBiC 14330]
MNRLILMISILFTSSVNAATSKIDTIKSIRASTNSISVVWAKNSWGDASSNECSTANGVLAIDTSTDAGKSILSIALAAMVSGKNVKFSTSTSQCLPVGGYAPYVVSVTIIN